MTTNRATAALSRRSLATPIGELRIVASDSGLRAVLWPNDDPMRVPSVSDEQGGPASVEAASSDEAPSASVESLLDRAQRQLEEYFAGSRVDFDVPLDAVGTDFQCRAWDALRRIPFGETVSYAQQAASMGDANKARAVGAANGRNPISIIVPCHRVVGADGSLTGFAGGLEVKRWLLDHERRVAGITLL